VSSPEAALGPVLPHRRSKPFEVGIYSFVENIADPTSGVRKRPERRIEELLAEIEEADRVGLDLFAIGEHHREEYLASAPDVLLAAAASRTERIRLSSAVTVLGSDDPVRVFQRFATLDLLSGGRAEIMAGRGSFVESFPLFGYDLRDYEELFEEKLELLLALRERTTIEWSGRHRPPLPGLDVLPRPLQDPLPVWIAVGGTPQSAVRTGRLGLPLALAILGGEPARFAPLAQLWRRAAAAAGHDADAIPMSLALHGFVAEDADTAIERFAPAAAVLMNRIGRERGWPPYGRRQVERDAQPDGALLIGSPEQLVEKILAHHALFDHDRVLIQLTVGSIPHQQVLEAIRLLGSEVAPVVRAEVEARRQGASPASA